MSSSPKSHKPQRITIYTELAWLHELDPFKRVSIIQGVASKDSNSGTEIRTQTFAHAEDVVIPSDEEVINVEYDRQMGVTRVTTSRAYDADRTAKERADRATPPATVYPQPAGAVPAPPEPPVTAFAWGSIDTSKVQNQATVAGLAPTIAAQEANTAQAPRPEALLDEVKAHEGVDSDKSYYDAAAEPSNLDDSETLKAAAELGEDSKS
jgi:hypothetical protein